MNQVLGNLLISHIEIRSEESIDIRQYVHERKVEKIVVPLGDELKRVKEQYLDVSEVIFPTQYFRSLYHSYSSLLCAVHIISLHIIHYSQKVSNHFAF